MASPTTTVKQATKSKKRKRTATLPSRPRFSFPYFAHEQLDPREFASSVGLPVGKPGWAPAPEAIANSSNTAWKDEDELLDAKDHIDEFKKDEKRFKITSQALPSRSTYKTLKTAGGRPALAKKVTADLDSDDELIVRMKNAKYLEKDIAQRLINEGRTKYNAKTIGTRYARIRKKLEERNDQLLDEELTDWHEGDDEALRKAKTMADEEIAKLITNVELKRWKLVKENLKSIKPVTNFSQKACRSRFNALEDGTARPTPESIENPTKKVLAKVAARKAKDKQIKSDTGYFKNMNFQDPQIQKLADENWHGSSWNSKKPVK